MAQKKNVPEVKSEPVISKLPIPISDSPLVIDLPDGQKLVVGKMIQGSVIEVATWRGTGRPDSRTSRLMLGMSVGDVNPTPEQKAAEAEVNGANQTSTKKVSQLSNPQLAKAQEFFWALTSHPIYKKLFGKPEPKVARVPKISVQSAPVEGSQLPAEPISPFTQSAESSAPVAKKSGLLSKLFGSKNSAPKMKKGKTGKKAKAFGEKKTSPSWATSTSSSKAISSSSSGADIDAWLDEISNMAKSRVESKSATAKKSTPAPKKSAPVRKPAKKSATVTKKRK